MILPCSLVPVIRGHRKFDECGKEMICGLLILHQSDRDDYVDQGICVITRIYFKYGDQVNPTAFHLTNMRIGGTFTSNGQHVA